VPSSRALAAALCEPYRRSAKRAVILELGAGTGPVTRHIGTLLGPRDELDICEINPDFADVIERNVLTNDDFASSVSEGRVRLLRLPAQDLNSERRYDFVICGIPFTSLDLALVQEIMAAIRHGLKARGAFSYFEYLGLRRLVRTFAPFDRKRFREVSDYMSGNIADYQFEQKLVWGNVPPARVRYLRFDS